MADPTVSVVVSTHSHAGLLPMSVASGLTQEGVDVELLIGGDGMTDETRASAERIAAADERVRVLDLPKAPRIGEENRDRTVEAARGEFVLYLADDDLWLPGHARAMCDVLAAGNEFVVALQLVVRADGTSRIVPHDYSGEAYRSLLLDGIGRVAMAALGHLREVYGTTVPRWRTSEGDPSDIEFARRYLEAGGRAMASTAEPSVILFPSPARTQMSATERERELERWSRRVADPGQLAELRAGFPAAMREAATTHDARAELLAGARERAETRANRLQERVAELDARLEAEREKRSELKARLEQRKQAIDRLRERVEELSSAR